MEEEEDATAAASPKDLALMSASPPELPTVSWVVGARLESKARDSSGGEQWFPAKVLEVEADKILVHYMQWNARHDEWIPSNSPRLRAAQSCNSGKSSRHNSGGGEIGISETELMTSLGGGPSATPMPAHKDFKPGEKVMATWKLNRKYLASVIRFEVSDGTYLVEFYDGVQCQVKPNNIRRPRKGEEDVESLRVNGAIDNGSAENSDNELSDMISPASSSGRRERKRKFDVKQLLNIRSVKSLRGSKDHEGLDTEAPSSHKRESSKRRRSRASNSLLDDSSESSVVNGNGSRPPPASRATSKSLANLEDGPALAAVSGKRERKKKKFWDDEQDEGSIAPHQQSSAGASPVIAHTGVVTVAAAPTPTTLIQGPLNSSGKATKDSVSSLATVSSSALKRKSSGGAGVAVPHKKVAKKSDSSKISEHPIIRPNGTVQTAESNHTSGTIEETISKGGKENGKVLPYLQLDLSSDPELIAEQMVEGVNIPGMGQPIPVDSSSLPDGWEKRVIQRRIGITKGKWDVFITNPETGKSFRSKTELQKHLDERKLPYTCDAFDFSLDDNLKRLRQIWKQYKVKPFLNNPKGSGSSGNFKHVPAKITQVQDADIVASSRSSSQSSASSAMQANSVVANCAAPTSATSSQLSKGHHHHSSGSTSQNPAAVGSILGNTPAGANNLSSSTADHFDMACLTEIAVESETGQGLRCSIAKCGKLFRNDRLLRQHVKHYHPKVYETVLVKHPQLCVDDISEPTSPEARRLSDSSDFFHENSHERRRVPSSDGFNKRASPYDEEQLEHVSKLKKGPGRPLKRSSATLLDEEAPLSNIYGQDNQDLLENSDDYVCRRTRNDSVLSSLNSDTEDHLSVSEHQQHRNSCPPTPPTFRLSKRRQAQMQRKRVQQPIVRMSKVEDTPLGRDYREEILSLQQQLSTSSTASAAFGPTILSSHTTSPSNNMDNAASCSSYPPSEMDASIAGSEHLTSEELVNCTCRRIEEDGLMIQCDICLCWQHGYCVGIEDEDPVPEKHVCETCRQPPGGRTEARFSLDQDWLKEGKLPSCEFALEDFNKKRSWMTSQVERETAFRKLSELMADLANLEKVLQSLRLKLHVASQSNNSKVFMWSSVWSLPTHQPQFQLEEDIDDEVEEDPGRLTSKLKKEPGDEEELMPPECESPIIMKVAKPSANDHLSRSLGSAIDPQEVAQKLSLIVAAENAIKKEQQDSSSFSPSPNQEREDEVETTPKVNGIPKGLDEIPPGPPQEEQLKSQRKSANHDQHDDEDDDNVKNNAGEKKRDEQASSSVSPVTSHKDDDHEKNVNSPTPPHNAVEKGIKENSDHLVQNQSPASEKQPLTNGNDSFNGDRREAEDDNSEKSSPPAEEEAVEATPNEKVKLLNGPSQSDGSSPPAFDEVASFLPSVSEVERLLPSVIQEIESGKDSAASSPPTSVAATSTAPASMSNGGNPGNSSLMMPEPKRLDRDECRLNLLQHIDNVQSEIQKRFKAIESVVFKLEVSNKCSSTGSDANSKVKAKLASLIQDLSISRQLMWTL